jgi:hypothetical protein
MVLDLQGNQRVGWPGQAACGGRAWTSQASRKRKRVIWMSAAIRAATKAATAARSSVWGGYAPCSRLCLGYLGHGAHLLQLGPCAGVWARSLTVPRIRKVRAHRVRNRKEAEPPMWNGSWTGRLHNPRTTRATGATRRAVCAASAGHARDRTYGKEKVYGSIP